MCGAALPEPDAACAACTAAPASNLLPAIAALGATRSRTDAVAEPSRPTTAPRAPPIPHPPTPMVEETVAGDMAREARERTDSGRSRAQGPSQGVLDVAAGALELEERGPRAESPWEPERVPRNWGRKLGRLVTAVLVVAALGGGGVWLWPRIQPSLKRAMGSGAAPMVSIQSEPEGATVLVDGTPVGETPLMMDNVYPERPIPVQLKRKGYRVWTGTFAGGEAATLDVRLQR
jgi:serine/threonine-protein kinase